jgi:formylglycine-generating enzyme required for sulfatase activity
VRVISSQISPKDGMVQVLVPTGEFLMGTTEEQIMVLQVNLNDVDRKWIMDETPQHTVYLDGFWIDQTEVTNAQYAMCVADGKCTPPPWKGSEKHWKYYGNPQFANYPVVNVLWNDAQNYCGWARQRLPSEAEWEKAARGTDGRIYPWGNALPNQKKLNYNKNQGDTTPVGSYPSGASPYGALDMAGNVYEWVADWYDKAYYQNSPARNPTGPSNGIYRVFRGGDFGIDDMGVRSAWRAEDFPHDGSNFIGFRCAYSP